MQRWRLTCSFAIVLSTLSFSLRLDAGANLQSVVNELMHGKRGAVIVSDPRTGRVLAVWNRQVAFHEAFPPGSTAKLVVSAAALEEGVVTPTESILCRRVPRLLGDSFHCSHPQAGVPFCLSAALANSCNYYFSELSSRLAAFALAHWYAAFGFEVASPMRESPRARALAALGAEGARATPAQVLMAYSAIATGGRVYHLVAPGEYQSPRLERMVPLKKVTLAVLSQALCECVENGTGRHAGVPGVSVAGKTGTAAARDGSAATQAWFAGYAPSGNPQIAVVVFLNRGTGGADAAPLAAEVFKAYFGRSGDAR